MMDYHRSANGVYEITVDGRLTKDEIDSIWASLKADMPASGKIKVLEVIRSFEGMDIDAMWEDLRVGLPMAEKVSHVAIVTDEKWIAAMTRMASVFISAETRAYTLDQLAQARAWIEAA